MPGAKGIAGNGHGAYESLQAALAFLSVGRQAEGTIRQAIAKMKSLSGGVREKLNIHADFAVRCSEAVTGFGPIFRFQSMAGQYKTGPKAGE
jgi:hypothetical protein